MRRATDRRPSTSPSVPPVAGEISRRPTPPGAAVPRWTRPRIRRVVRGALLAGGVGAGAWMLTACVPVATYVVDSNVDAVDANIGDGVCATAAGQCTLRAAVQEGNVHPATGFVRVELGGFEVFPLTIVGSGEDASATGDLDLTRAFQFMGTGLPTVTSAVDRVFDAHPAADLELVGVRATGTVTGDGGVIRARQAKVTVTAGSLGGKATGVGGAIASNGSTVTLTRTGIGKSNAPAGAAISADQLNLVQSSITTASGVGSVVRLTDPAATSTIDTSTIAGNQATSGGIISPAGHLAVRDSTIARNSSTVGAVLHGSSLTVANSIVADQAAGPDCHVPATSLGHNLESSTSCGFTAPGDLQGSTASLPASPQEAGTTVVLAPIGGLAIDSGSGCLAADQVGVARPIDGDADGTATCDRGAVEVEAHPLVLSVDDSTDAVDAVPGDGLCATAAGSCTLRAAIMETNARGTADVIDLPGGVLQSLSLAGAGEDASATGDLDITGDLTIRSDHEGNLLAYVDANDIDRAFDVRAGTVRFEKVVVADGTEVTGGGGIRTLAGTDVTIATSMVFGSSAVGGGGGGVHASGHLVIDRSTVYGNQGGAHGGGLFVGATGVVTITSSTFTTNTATAGSALAAGPGSQVSVTDSTLARNTGTGVEGGASVTIRGSIVSGHAAGNCSTAVTSLRSNLDSGTTCGFAAVGDATGVDPLLGTPNANGGATLSLRPAAGSPAIGTSTCSTPIDQPGTARPQGGACDKGSVEQ